MTAERPAARGSRWWVWTIVVGAGLIGGMYAVQAWSGSDLAPDGYYATVSLLTSITIVVGIVVHRPARPLPWLLLAAGQFVYTAGDVTYLVLAAHGNYDFPSLADALYLMQFPFVIVALGLIIRRRTPGWHAP